MATRQILGEQSHAAFLLDNAHYLLSSMARTKLTPKQGGEGQWEVGPEVERGEEGPGRERMEAPFSHAPPIPSQGALVQKRGGEADEGGREVGGGSKKAGGCGQVTIIVANPTVDPDGCRGWAIYIGSGGASQKEALTYHGEAKPPGQNSSRLVKLKRPGSIALAQLLFGRSGSSNRALSSLSGNSPSCS